ncbi:MAG TPA: hypothetical protein VGN26_03910 [Armatimonadota bacterium]|jgi:hypothetical protein
MRQASTAIAPTFAAEIAATLDATCVIQRRTLVSDGAGGSAETWVQVGGTIPCRLFTARQQAVSEERGGALTSLLSWQGAVPLGTSVGPQDRLVSGGRTYEVLQTNVGENGAPCITLYLQQSL